MKDLMPVGIDIVPARSSERQSRQAFARSLFTRAALWGLLVLV